ncbi:MAG: HEAT repeat domain-containing protein [bacterium]
MADDKKHSAEIEPLVASLRDKDGMVRENARDRLVTFGSSATPFLIPLLGDNNTQTRWEAAKALGEIADPASIPALLDTLEDEDDDVAWLAAEALVAIGPPAAAPLLQRLIDRFESISTQQGVHHVLRELRHTEIKDTIGPVYEALSRMHSDTEVIADAEKALEQLKRKK